MPLRALGVRNNAGKSLIWIGESGTSLGKKINCKIKTIKPIPAVIPKALRQP
ncbi:hypothetical protein D3C76_1602570 [compost metagenome]